MYNLNIKNEGIVMKILITGGLGFIGVNFTKYILGKYKDAKVVVLDKLTYAANREMLSSFKHFSNFKFYKGDISNYKFLEKVFLKEKFDYVVNFAAETSVDKSFIDPTLFYLSNLVGISNLAILSKKYSIKRLHQVSTDEIYGDLPLDSKKKFKESDPLNAKNPYSLSKAQAEEFLMMYSKIYDLDVTISRSANNFGPYQAKDKLIPLTISRILAKQDIPLFGEGENIRDWIFVLDHAKAIDLILFNGKKQEIYNVSSQNPLKNIDVVNILLKKLKGNKELIKHVEDRRVHDLKYAIDTTKIEKELGFKADYDFDYALDLTLDYYKN